MSDDNVASSPSVRDSIADMAGTKYIGSILDGQRDHHPGEEYEALPNDATRPTEVTIRPRYAEDATTVWVSAAIEDTISLMDAR